MLKVDIRNRLLKPKVGEIITVIGDIVKCSKLTREDDVIFKLIERKRTKEVENE